METRKKTALAERIGVLGKPLGLLDVAAAADDSVVFHEHHIGLLCSFSDIRRHLVGAGRAIRRHRDLPKEDVGFRIGDAVSIISGMFEGYSGTGQEISEDKKQVTVLASTGKRDIPIIVEAKDIKKAD